MAICFCRSEILSSKLENQPDKSLTSIWANSPICLPSILKCKDSFFSLNPSQSGQILISKKSFNQSCVFSDPLSCWRFRKFIIPSYLVLHSVPTYFFEGTGTGSSVPYNIRSRASRGNLAMGVDKPTE